MKLKFIPNTLSFSPKSLCWISGKIMMGKTVLGKTDLHTEDFTASEISLLEKIMEDAAKRKDVELNKITK